MKNSYADPTVNTFEWTVEDAYIHTTGITTIPAPDGYLDSTISSTAQTAFTLENNVLILHNFGNSSGSDMTLARTN